MNIVNSFKLTRPDNSSFSAVIVDDGGNLVVASNASGEWAVDDTIAPADLLMPEFRFSEWDVVETDPPRNILS